MKRTVENARKRGKRIESGTKKFRRRIDAKPNFS
jgi:hypothetical protein